MAVFLDSLTKAADYFGGVISPQRLGQLADAQQLHSQEVASARGGATRKGMFHEHVALHLEQAGRLVEHDCPCWRVAYAQGAQELPASDVEHISQELLDLERAESATELEYRQAALRTAQGDVAELQQQVEELRQQHAELQETAASFAGEVAAREEYLEALKHQAGEDMLLLALAREREADLRRRIEHLYKQHREEVRVLHYELEVHAQQRATDQREVTSAVSMQSWAFQEWIKSEDNLHRWQRFISPVLAVAGGGVGWALERFVLG